MLSNYIAGNGVVLIVDRDGQHERHAEQLIRSSLLQPASATSNIHVLPRPPPLDTFTTTEAASIEQQLSSLDITDQLAADVVLVHVAEFIQTASLRHLLQLVHRLKHHSPSAVRQLFLWLSPRHLLTTSSAGDQQTLAAPYLEHMSGACLTLQNARNMQLVVRKPGGLVQRRNFSYTAVRSGRFDDVAEVQKPVALPASAGDETPVNPESLTTFKINFDEEEMEARTALKLPYERTSDKPAEAGGKIIYSPDADDDFDEEDPDDDLNI